MGNSVAAPPFTQYAAVEMPTDPTEYTSLPETAIPPGACTFRRRALLRIDTMLASRCLRGRKTVRFETIERATTDVNHLPKDGRDRLSFETLNVSKNENKARLELDLNLSAERGGVQLVLVLPVDV